MRPGRASIDESWKQKQQQQVLLTATTAKQQQQQQQQQHELQKKQQQQPTHAAAAAAARTVAGNEVTLQTSHSRRQSAAARSSSSSSNSNSSSTSSRCGASSPTCSSKTSSSSSSSSSSISSSKSRRSRESTTSSHSSSNSSIRKMSSDLHPHDQHGRHMTHALEPHGARERSQAEELSRRSKLPPLTLSRDDFPSSVLSVRYRDRCIQLSPNRLECRGHKGWASVFATHACSSGKFYFEAEVLAPRQEGLLFEGFSSDCQPTVNAYFRQDTIRCFCRVGWACRYQSFDLPIGCNAFSYALSDFGGCSLLHAARRKELPLHQQKCITAGDVIGCFICLPEPKEWPPDPREDSKLFEYLQAGILCRPENPPTPRSSSPDESFVDFSLNGQKLPRVFAGLSEGAYHPSISLYMGACIRFNPGPIFKFPPPEGDGFVGACCMQRPFIP
ncbi:hypothetical protein Efla_000084 [Eimeria flavescens]